MRHHLAPLVHHAEHIARVMAQGEIEVTPHVIEDALRGATRAYLRTGRYMTRIETTTQR